jgi:AmmeMemoRadiSam system protein B
MKEFGNNGSNKIRAPAAAGRFYPKDPGELRRLVNELLAEVPPTDGPVPKALIAPHAGYLYSGPIAASAYARLKPARQLIRRIVLVGPAHFVPFDGLAASGADAFATPLGLVRVDVESIGRLAGLTQVAVLDIAHAHEHSLEVHLPFLQMALADFTLVPLVVGEATAEQVCEVLDALWDGPETRFVISSDLSHYLDSDEARQMDRLTADAVEGLHPEDIGDEQACGRIPIRGLLQAARGHGLRARAVDLRNSGDTSGPRHQVVGYGAFVFEEAVPQRNL